MWTSFCILGGTRQKILGIFFCTSPRSIETQQLRAFDTRDTHAILWLATFAPKLRRFFRISHPVRSLPFPKSFYHVSISWSLPQAGTPLVSAGLTCQSPSGCSHLTQLKTPSIWTRLCLCHGNAAFPISG